MPSTLAIRVRGLRKRYDDADVLRGVDLDVRHGEIVAFLGPNGAGKTTTIEILEGFRSRDDGEVCVLGVDPRRQARAWRERIGIVTQESEPDPVAALAAAVLVLVVAGNAYDVAIPSAALPGVVVTVVLGSATLSALAYALASVIDAVGSTQPVVALMVLPLLVISGVLVPAAHLPSALDTAARLFPLEHIAHGLRHAFDSGAAFGVDATDVLVLAGWTAAGLAFALHRFDWTPRRRG